MRITGLASGLDMDSIIKESMKPYRIKIDQTKQKKDLVEVKQQLYRDIIKDSRSFYDKNFDVTKPDSLLLTKNWSTTTFSSTDETTVKATGLSGAVADNYTVEVSKLASKATATIGNDVLTSSAKSITINYGGKDIIIDNITSGELAGKKLLSDRINLELKNNSVLGTVKYSEFSQGIVFSSDALGSNTTGTTPLANKVSIEVLDNSGSKITNSPIVGTGSDANVTITNSRGEVKQYTGSSNSVTYDGVQFSFKDVSKVGEPIKITGSLDTKNLKDKLVAFVNDYNILREKLNKAVTDKANSTYMPLTEEQKKSMSEDEVKMWNEKVKTGQLNGDADVLRLVNSLKSSLSAVDFKLDKFGISPVSDYKSSKNGTLQINEAKLDEALKKIPEEVLNLAIGTVKDSKGNEIKGFMQVMKTTLYNEVVTNKASLIKKAGIEGSSTAYLNELTTSLNKYSKTIEDMEKKFSDREQSLYTKFSKLEVAMNKYNSQQSYMAQATGGGM